jgi:NodT family efflux transporter outer membrane factor (OMF) lipoprotein
MGSGQFLFARPLSAAAAALAAALIAGCAAGPDFHRPPAPQASRYTPEPLAVQTASANVSGGAAQRFVPDMDIPHQWWTLFRSPQLNALIEQAIKANPDMQAAAAALRQAMENVKAQQGAFYPAIQAAYSPSRQKSAATLASPLASNVSIYSLYTAQATVSYTPDVFGLNRRTVEYLKAQAAVQRYQLEATYLTLTSNVVNAAVQEATLRAQLAATAEVIRFETEALGLMRRQYRAGAIAMADVVAQQAALAQAQAGLVPLQKQLAQMRDLLTRLLGRTPDEEPAERFELSSLHLPEDLPLTLPSKLVEQRPDVRAAEEQLHAATAEVGVAVANMLPQFSLSADVGSVATQAAMLGGSGASMWLAAGNITQTLFAGGTLLHRKRAAEAGLDQAAALYRSTVLNAFENVVDVLRALQYDADAVRAQAAAERSAAESLDIARVALKLGSISYLSLLSAEQAYQQALIGLAQAQGNRYADTAALFQALGGGWWNRPELGKPIGASHASHLR